MFLHKRCLIKIIYSHFFRFGRWDTQATCISDIPDNLVTDKNCSVEGVNGRVIEKCQGEEQCSLVASNTELGEGCEDVYKYLELNFTCKGW